MGVLWLVLVLSATGSACQLNDEQYHQMPQLFQLDDYEVCLSQRRGAFCMGTFDLVESSNSRLFNVIQKFSEQRTNFNHTRVHRGFCVNSRCHHIEEPSISRTFVKCVRNLTKGLYGLDAKLSSLDYCKTSRTPPPAIDGLDVAFAYACAAILLMNVIGTAYDFFRNVDRKPNRFLMAWSIAQNWRRLTDPYENGDPRLSAFQSIHGMKALTLILVMLAHSVIVYHATYIHNPQFLERANRHPASTLLHNGSVVVQSFIMLSSFLLAYNLIIYVENNPKKQLNLSMYPNVLLNRISRITPLYVFMIGFVTTWWRLSSDGATWAPLVEAECARCRAKWWTQLLYINNFVMPDDKCLIQTWFLAVDMQLYILASFLTLTLGRSPWRAVKILAGLFLFSVLGNFAIAYYFDLKAILFLTYPELLRHQYTAEPSFNWMYMAPWGSLPSSLLGLLAAFLLYHWQKNNFKPEESLTFRVMYRCSLPLCLIWVLSGCLVKDTQSRLVTAVYAALDRPVFCVLIVVAMFGFIHKIDNACWRLMSWSGWRPLSRMSLSILLVHFCYNLTQVAIKTNLARTSIYEIGGNWFVTIFMTYLTSLPLHLLVELPLHMFFKSFIS
ncbi:unnamed protein product, partial [Iphiclides podalirius]